MAADKEISGTGDEMWAEPPCQSRDQTERDGYRQDGKTHGRWIGGTRENTHAHKHKETQVNKARAEDH